MSWPRVPQLEGELQSTARALPLEDALKLVHLYFERGSSKAEPAARRGLVRHLIEGTPSLRAVAKVTASLAGASLRRGPDPGA
jgi:hypothetical protein